VVDARNQLLASHGDPDTVTYLRSSSKPFQALPFIESGGDDYFGLDEKELAILCASHSGTDDHVAVVRGLQHKIGIGEEMLQCGTHNPGDAETWIAMNLRGEQPLPVRHMCSGKHTGMLGFAKMMDAPLTNYLSMEHPVQRAILKTLSEMTDLQLSQIVIGIDGCSAPNFALPLRSAALAIAHLCQPDELSPVRAAACKKISSAMMGQPLMIAGPGKFDTELMQATSPKIVSKGGAEGYQILGVLPDAIEPGSPALGITIKISDGDADNRARQATTYEILRQLGALSRSQAEALKKYGPRRIYNFARLDIGEYRSYVQLPKSD